MVYHKFQIAFLYRVFCFIILFQLNTLTIVGQVGISENPIIPDPSSILDIENNTKGVLFPRMSQSERNLINNPAHSLFIYQNDQNPGFYYNSGNNANPSWTKLSQDNVGICIDSLPFNISVPGYYYFKTNLNSDVANITVNTSNITINLNGFTLNGLPGNTLAGIDITGAYEMINVFNGTISNWGKEGIKGTMSSNCSFSSLYINNNGRDGILVGNGAIVSNIVSHSNTFDGIDCGSFSLLDHCITTSNGAEGIEVDNNGIIQNCNSNGNTFTGIKAGNFSKLYNSNSSSNGNHGVAVGQGSHISSSSSNENINSGFFLLGNCEADNNNAQNNSSYGFEIKGSYCQIKNNNAFGSTLSGFYTDFSHNTIDGNTSNFNDTHGFEIESTNCLIIKNNAMSNVILNYYNLAGNLIAPIITSANIGTNNNPNANVSN